MGDGPDAAALAVLLGERLGRQVSMPRAVYELTPAGAFPEVSPWGFRWVEAPVGADPEAARWLTPEEHPEVERLLDESFPHASFRPSSPRARRWAGVHDADGRLVACAGDTTEAPGVGFVAAITTASDLRGRGIGRTLTGWVLDRLVEDEGLAALWHYGGNAEAIRVYDALGMRRLDMVGARRA
jgi:GNAT superfamily N-acetyltransferase